MGTKDNKGAEGEAMREQFGYDKPGEPESHTPDRSSSVHDAGKGSQKVDKTGTPGADRQWPSSQPDDK